MFGFFTDKKRWGTLLREETVQLSFLARVKEEDSDEELMMSYIL